MESGAKLLSWDRQHESLDGRGVSAEQAVRFERCTTVRKATSLPESAFQPFHSALESSKRRGGRNWEPLESPLGHQPHSTVGAIEGNFCSASQGFTDLAISGTAVQIKPSPVDLYITVPFGTPQSPNSRTTATSPSSEDSASSSSASIPNCMPPLLKPAACPPEQIHSERVPFSPATPFSSVLSLDSTPHQMLPPSCDEHYATYLRGHSQAGEMVQVTRSCTLNAELRTNQPEIVGSHTAVSGRRSRGGCGSWGGGSSAGIHLAEQSLHACSSLPPLPRAQSMGKHPAPKQRTECFGPGQEMRRRRVASNDSVLFFEEVGNESLVSLSDEDADSNERACTLLDLKAMTARDEGRRYREVGRAAVLQRVSQNLREGTQDFAILEQSDKRKLAKVRTLQKTWSAPQKTLDGAIPMLPAKAILVEEQTRKAWVAGTETRQANRLLVKAQSEPHWQVDDGMETAALLASGNLPWEHHSSAWGSPSNTGQESRLWEYRHVAEHTDHVRGCAEKITTAPSQQNLHGCYPSSGLSGSKYPSFISQAAQQSRGSFIPRVPAWDGEKNFNGGFCQQHLEGNNEPNAAHCPFGRTWTAPVEREEAPTGRPLRAMSLGVPPAGGMRGRGLRQRDSVVRREMSDDAEEDVDSEADRVTVRGEEILLKELELPVFFRSRAKGNSAGKRAYANRIYRTQSLSGGAEGLGSKGGGGALAGLGVARCIEDKSTSRPVEPTSELHHHHHHHYYHHLPIHPDMLSSQVPLAEALTLSPCPPTVLLADSPAPLTAEQAHILWQQQQNQRLMQLQEQQNVHCRLVARGGEPHPQDPLGFTSRRQDYDDEVSLRTALAPSQIPQEGLENAESHPSHTVAQQRMAEILVVDHIEGESPSCTLHPEVYSCADGITASSGQRESAPVAIGASLKDEALEYDSDSESRERDRAVLCVPPIWRMGACHGGLIASHEHRAAKTQHQRTRSISVLDGVMPRAWGKGRVTPSAPSTMRMSALHHPA